MDISRNISGYFDSLALTKPEYFQKIKGKVSYEVSQISTVLKKDVSWRFQRLWGKTIKLCNLDKEKRKLVFPDPSLLRDYSDVLFELINYRWTQKLEDFNSAPRISQKVRGTDWENRCRAAIIFVRNNTCNKEKKSCLMSWGIWYSAYWSH